MGPFLLLSLPALRAFTRRPKPTGKADWASAEAAEYEPLDDDGGVGGAAGEGGLHCPVIETLTRSLRRHRVPLSTDTTVRWAAGDGRTGGGAPEPELLDPEAVCCCFLYMYLYMHWLIRVHVLYRLRVRPISPISPLARSIRILIDSGLYSENLRARAESCCCGAESIVTTSLRRLPLH